jgi:hypothetical protein
MPSGFKLESHRPRGTRIRGQLFSGVVARGGWRRPRGRWCALRKTHTLQDFSPGVSSPQGHVTFLENRHFTQSGYATVGHFPSRTNSVIGASPENQNLTPVTKGSAGKWKVRPAGDWFNPRMKSSIRKRIIPAENRKSNPEMKTSNRSGKLPSENRSAVPQKEHSARKPKVRSGNEISVRNTKVRSGRQTVDPLPPPSIR